jgi:H/ACA ribonucleoprotein complex subunit 4
MKPYLFETKNKRLIKKRDMTNHRYGKTPNERTLIERIKSGVVIIDKPSGPTSHQISAWVKEILNIEKAGHSGTLDPNVTGVLPIALNDAVKAIGTFNYGTKEYVGIARFHKDIDEEKIQRIFAKFVGEIYQTPPVRSAVKRELRKRWIHYLDVLEIEDRDVLFRVGCQAGTYIRTLVNDIGLIYGSGAHMQELRRTRVALFTEEDANTLHELKDAFVAWKEEHNEKELNKIIRPMETIVEHIPKIVVKDSAVDALCHGAKLALPGILELDDNISKDTLVAIMTLKGEAVALGNAVLSSKEIMEKNDGFAVDIRRVLMMPGTYPSMWKRGDKK